jgi:hypothetical protein
MAPQGDARLRNSSLFRNARQGDSRLRRRLLAIEKLDATEKRQVLQLIDAFIERGQLRTKVQSRSAQ